MKRVICWDLWGTLIQSGYMGQSYEDYLCKWKKREEIQAFVREFLMTNKAPRGSQAMRAFVSQYFGTPYITVIALSATVVPLPLSVMGIIDWEHTTNLWDAENYAAEWINGARETIRAIRTKFPQDTHVLVTNTSDRGWRVVNEKLRLSREFSVPVIRSCDFARAKPHSDMWERVQAQYQADEYWMIGDSEVLDLVTPRSMSWKTILVEKNGMPVSQVPTIIYGGQS